MIYVTFVILVLGNVGNYVIRLKFIVIEPCNFLSVSMVLKYNKSLNSEMECTHRSESVKKKKRLFAGAIQKISHVGQSVPNIFHVPEIEKNCSKN